MTILALLLSLFLQAPATPASPAMPSRLEGVVVQAINGDPLAKATVELRNGLPGDAATYSATTSDNGNFVLRNIRPGAYSFVVSRQGYVSVERGSLVLAPGQNRSDLKVAMVRTGLITGKVMARGQPLVLADVFALKASYADGRRVMSVVESTKTNPAGEYRLFWLAPGTYYVAVVVTPPDTFGNNTQILNRDGTDASLYMERFNTRTVLTRPIGNGTGANEIFVPLYFPGSADYRAARAIDVRTGAEVNGIDIDAPPAPALHVRGKVSPVPVQRSAINLIALNAVLTGGTAASTSNQQTAQTTPDGSFDFGGVAPGPYILQMSAGSLTGRKLVEVVDRDLSVGVDLTAGLNVTGKVSFEGKGDADPRFVTFRVNLRAEPAISPQYTSGALSAAGVFTIPNVVEGTYRVYVNPLIQPVAAAGTAPSRVPSTLQNSYVKSIRLGDRDVLNEGLQIEGNFSGQLEIVIGDKPGSMEGRVLDERQQPVAGATVALLPDGGLRFRVDQKFAVTDDSGRVQFTAVPPGEYKLFAWTEVERGAWQDPEFIHGVEDRGKPVHIDEGSHVNVDVTAIP